MDSIWPMNNNISSNYTNTITNRYEDDTPWTMKETSTLIELISKGDESWPEISKQIGKTPQQCSDWFEYLEDISKHIPKRQKSTKPFVQHRKRRKAAQIERLYKCQEKYCYRSYGTEGALKMHIKLKHPSVTYNESYQQQARNAAMLSEKMLEDEEEEGSDEEIPIHALVPAQIAAAAAAAATAKDPKRMFMRPAATPVQPVTDPVFVYQQGVKRTFSQDIEEFHTDNIPLSWLPRPPPPSQPLCDLRRTSSSMFDPLPRVEFHPMQINFLCK